MVRPILWPRKQDVLGMAACLSCQTNCPCPLKLLHLQSQVTLALWPGLWAVVLCPFPPPDAEDGNRLPCWNSVGRLDIGAPAQTFLGPTTDVARTRTGVVRLSGAPFLRKNQGSGHVFPFFFGLMFYKPVILCDSDGL